MNIYIMHGVNQSKVPVINEAEVHDLFKGYKSCFDEQNTKHFYVH